MPRQPWDSHVKASPLRRSEAVRRDRPSAAAAAAGVASAVVAAAELGTGSAVVADDGRATALTAGAHETASSAR